MTRTRLVPAPERTEERVRALGVLDANGTTTITLPRRRVGQPAIVSRMIAAIPAAGGPVLRDTFSRVVGAGGWGTPSEIGPAYVITEGAGADYSVPAANVGRIAPPGGIVHCIGSPVSAKDVTMIGNLLSTGAVINGPPPAGLGPALRIVPGAATYYALLLRNTAVVAPGTTDAISIMRRVAGVSTVLAGPVVLPAALVNPVSFRFSVIGGLLSGAVWNTAEPASQVTALDFTIPGPGGVGIHHTAGAAGNSGDYDNLEATPSASSPIWDAYIDNSSQLVNLIDSSVTAVDRWIPQITNGQRLNPGEQLVIVPRAGIQGTQIVVTCSFVYAT